MTTLSSSLNFGLIHISFSKALSQLHLLGPNASLLSTPKKNILEAGTFGNVAQASPIVTEENALDWAKTDNRRLLHAVYRVGDLEKTIK